MWGILELLSFSIEDATNTDGTQKIRYAMTNHVLLCICYSVSGAYLIGKEVPIDRHDPPGIEKDHNSIFPNQIFKKNKKP